MLTRLKRREDGFAMVTAVAVLAIMSILLVVVLTAGNSAFEVSERNARFTRTLAVAEAGIDDVAGTLGVNGAATSLCPIGTSNTCSASGGEYQVSWTREPDGTVTVTSVGYQPSMANAQITRKIEAVYEPVPSFKYAVYSDTSIAIKNNQVVIGDIFANGAIQIGTDSVICGSVTSATGGVEMMAGSRVVKTYVDDGKNCFGKSGNVWASGTIKMGATSVVQGDATASPPAGTLLCPLVPDTTYAILSGTVQGNATACGKITASSPNPLSPYTLTDPSLPRSIPSFTFDPNNYTGITCIPFSNPCDPANTSDIAYSQFNALSKVNMKGVYAVWQTNPTCGQIWNPPSSQCTKLDLTGLNVGGDLTIITNAPVYFGNTTVITSSGPALVTIVSVYEPPAFTTCDSNGGNCSIYGLNSVIFDSGDPADPNDGIAAVLYTPGKMAFKNEVNGAEGALYAGSLDIKNGFDITWTGRIERIAGFGEVLERTLWREISE